MDPRAASAVDNLALAKIVLDLAVTNAMNVHVYIEDWDPLIQGKYKNLIFNLGH